MKEFKELVIIGAGPAGMAASVDADNSRIDFAIIDSEEPGWYAKYSINQHYYIDGYLGAYKETGTSLDEKFKKHLETKRISVIKARVEKVEKKSTLFYTYCDNGVTYISKFLILATGTRPRNLHLNNYEKFKNKYIFNFVCKEDINLNGKKVVVLGGRNSGTTTAIYVSRETTADVTLIEKDSKLNATPKYIERLERTNVKVITNGDTIQIDGNDKLKSITVKIGTTYKKIDADYLFVCIGTFPCYDFLKLNINKDSNSRIWVNPETMETSVENMFAIGDINQLLPKQVSNATANGKTAVYFIGKRI